jgi:DNA-binding NarL/FixJ family response regulator
MELWKRLLAVLRTKPDPDGRYFALETPLQAAVAKRVDPGQPPPEQVQAELLANALKQCWETLSWREQQVTAFTCLGYTNRQMAARMQLSPSTVKGYIRGALFKWNAHSKEGLYKLLEQWDFSGWGPPAERDEMS